MPQEDFIERRIITGLIVSTDYNQQIQPIWDSQYLESPELKMMAGWCADYFEKYQAAPGNDIETIYTEQLKLGLDKERAEFVELILESLSEEYERENKFNVQYLVDQTRKYFKQRHLALHSEEIDALVQEGELEEAEKKAAEYSGLPDGLIPGLDLSSQEAQDRVEKAFNTKKQSVVRYPGALGQMWNSQLTRGGLVSLMGPEKRGKTFWLMDIAMRAIKSKSHAAFFQAGDMTEDQQLKRICVCLAGRSDKERYCGTLFLPTRDCWLNQTDQCDREDRDCDFGILPEDAKPGEVTFETLHEARKNNQDYEPCWKYKCKDYKGAVWLKKKIIKDPLTAEPAQGILKQFFTKHKTQFRLSTHANGSLSVREIRNTLAIWERQGGFVPDVIVVDYADLLISDFRTDQFRHQQNEIWKGLRGLSQEKHCLVVTATQADAKSYEQDTLRLSNFSEDKRKYAHVTAMYGLNQDPKGREKKLGIMRINELVVREDEFYSSHHVHVLQRLQIGRPYLGSF